MRLIVRLTERLTPFIKIKTEDMSAFSKVVLDTISQTPENIVSLAHHNSLRDSSNVGLPTSNLTLEPTDNVTGQSSSFSNIVNPPVTAPFYTGLNGVNLILDNHLVTVLWVSICIAASIVLIMRLVQRFVAYIRNIFCMATRPAQQRYYAINHSMIWALLKKQIVYAPLVRKRHNRELQLSSATNYGTLPGRIHFLLLVMYAVSNMVYCLLLDWKTPEKGALYAELRGRSGVLATVNLIPLVVFASRNNLAIPILRVSFDTFNLFHRWIGRIVVVEATVHVLAWMAAYIEAKGKDATPAVFSNNPFLQYGLVGLVAMLVMAFHSFSALRHAFYETFLHIHQACAFLAMLGIYVHLDMARLPAYPSIRAAVFLFILERLARLSRLIYLNFSREGGITTVLVEALPGDASRVTFQLPRHVKIRPGSHVYAYLPTVSLWMSHPFSVAWTNIESEPCTTQMVSWIGSPKTPNSLERQSMPGRFPPSRAPTTVSLVMVARTGMTRQLYNAAKGQVGGKLHLRGFLEGPYAGHESLTSYGTVVMFAGGGGITHHLVQIRHLLAGAQLQTVATRKIVLIWSIRDTVAMEWVKPWMTEILHMEGRREILKIVVYASRPNQPINVSKNKSTMQIVEGRVDPGTVLDEVICTRIGAMMVSVCGPGALADEVRAAVRSRIHLANVDMNEESFTW
ncbi:hypothetical protein LTR10_017710 [Elasticomyces elasticus]|uniref:FAD-binding FR-type domain-containing protein n=1 Tax=Exophiala sideris TaxID=1016849 RepID=A0ABR0JBH9_9EURO|nr:hypothetical protein LTR10_017710 [Elasticomyces elasticus]KAK5031041.1 hypothetical protein LTS07_004776 [Exophiala sideris]KAK5038763.1 hypothetical protein LTR13_003794 [Exophiala sideris]KAK5060646.1 hypothetical protein LTR69_005245 [Exophiala sideris]KAK5183559.1 hypothetical protein LTR44_003841 [Eurotiomycetes sp. CCFEE 6388]